MDTEQLLDHDEIDASGRRKSISYELNLRVMLAAYHLRTGAVDITKLFTMLGFSKMINFERTFTRHESYINDGIIEVTQNIIEQAMIKEITACAEKQLNKSFSTMEIARHVEGMTKKQFGKLNVNIPSICLAISYDMAW